MAQCRLPFSFNILSKLPPRQRPPTVPGTGKRPQPEQGAGESPAPEPRAVRRQMDDAAGSVDCSFVQPQEITPPTLTEVNPDSGSITGGVRIWLRGMDFPALLPLFARFGAAVVPTVRIYLYLSRYLILFARLSLLPISSPVTCLPEAAQASSMSRYRSNRNKMHQSMELALRDSNTKVFMMNCESSTH